MSGRRLIGKLLNSEYRILDLLGEGGMGAVYLAEQESLARKLAIKVIHPPVNEELQLRIQREGLILSKLDHPNIVRIYAFGYLDDGSLFLAMEYLQGRTLSKALLDSGKLDWRLTLLIAVQICLALEHIHQQSIIHRDLKPENIMLCHDASSKLQVKLLDMGLAKAHFESGFAVLDLTNSGVLIGTPHYMSPEQCKGQPADARCDLYALACIIYRCLYGRCPFDADYTIGILHKHVNEVPELDEIAGMDKAASQCLRAILCKALAKEAQHRFQNAAELGALLQSVLDGTLTLPGLKIEPLKWQSKMLGIKSKKSFVLYVFAVTALLIFSSVVIYFTSQKSKSDSAAHLKSTDSGNQKRIAAAYEFLEKAERSNQMKDQVSTRSFAGKSLYSLSNLKAPSLNERSKAIVVLERIGQLFVQWKPIQSAANPLRRASQDLMLKLNGRKEDDARVNLVLARIETYYLRGFDSSKLYAAAMSANDALLREATAFDIYDEYQNTHKETFGSASSLEISLALARTAVVARNQALADKAIEQCDDILASMPDSESKAMYLFTYYSYITPACPERAAEVLKQAAEIGFANFERRANPVVYDEESWRPDYVSLAEIGCEYYARLLKQGDLKSASLMKQRLERLFGISSVKPALIEPEALIIGARQDIVSYQSGSRIYQGTESRLKQAREQLAALNKQYDFKTAALKLPKSGERR